MPKTLVKVNNACFSYDGKHQALEKISLKIKGGEVVGIAGPNGAGKSTLLKLIVGLLKPDKGRVEVHHDKAVSQPISYLPQNTQRIDPSFPATVREVVSMGLYNRIGILERMNEEQRQSVQKAIENVGLRGFEESQITNLSGGQLQRAFIGRALVSNPTLLILDEPTAAVDLAGEEEFYELINNINEVYGVAVLLVSHDVYSLIDHTKRLIFINKRILYDGEPTRLDNSRLLKMLFSHSHSKGLVRRLERASRKRGR